MLIYAVQHNNEQIRMKSRSGGIFTALSDWVINNNGSVYGCVLNEKFEAVHIRAISVSDRDRMRGSKYVQSKIGDTYKLAEIDLKEGMLVLFSGTSCQIDGFKSYLGKEYSNLICVDIVCHGVPSPVVWRKYLEWQLKGEEPLEVDFRNKMEYGWRAHVETIKTNDRIIDSEVYKNIFYGHNCLRPSCYVCKYKSLTHPGDITIADYWGIENAAPEFDDDKGTSLVLINSEKGKKIFDYVKRDLKYKETDIEKSMQEPLIAPFPKPINRERFWIDLKTKEFDFIANKYGTEKPTSLFVRVKRKVKKVLNI